MYLVYDDVEYNNICLNLGGIFVLTVARFIFIHAYRIIIA